MRAKTFVEALEPRTLLSTTRVVAYYPDWEHSGGALMNKIDFAAITHLNYFSIVPGTNGSIPTSSCSGFSFAQMDTVVAAAHAKGVSVSIVIGGAGLDHTMMPIAQNPTALANFVTNIRNFCAAHALDGIDLDWEPAWGTATVATINAYGGMITALKTGAPELILSAAVNPTMVPTDSGNRFVVPPGAVNKLDLVNVMAYDITVPNHSEYNQSVGLLSSWASFGLANGAARSKFILGMPFYGHENSWATSRTYQQLVDTYADVRNNPALDNAGGWYFNGRTTIANKSNYVVSNNYGGVMIWQLAQDHFTSGAYDQYSLLPVIKTTTGLTAFTTLSAGNLVATGDANANAFSLAVVGTNLEITLGNTTRTYPLSIVNTITINGLDGNDSVTINSPLSKPVTFNAGNDDDSLTVAAGASVQFNATQRIESLNIAGTATMQANGGRVLVTKSLNLTGTLDLNDNDLVLDYAGLTQAAAMQSLINTARNGGTWTGLGLTSSAAKNANPKNATLAVLESSEFLSLYPGQPFSGEPIDATAVLVKYTYYGDTDFNGLVDFDDYSRADSGFNNNRTGWLNGDFDGNGVVDFDDYSLIDQAFNTQGAALRPAVTVRAGRSAKGGR